MQQALHDTYSKALWPWKCHFSVFCSPCDPCLTAFRKCDLLCWSVLFLLWQCVKIKGYLDIAGEEQKAPGSLKGRLQCQLHLKMYLTYAATLPYVEYSWLARCCHHQVQGARAANWLKSCLHHKNLQGYLLWVATSGLLTWGWKRSLQGPHTRSQNEIWPGELHAICLLIFRPLMIQNWLGFTFWKVLCQLGFDL